MANNNMEDLLYNELLATSGYEVDFAVGMTYSLDLDAMLSVALAFGMLGELDNTTQRNPLYLLEAVRKSADKMLVFCNKGQIKVPKDNKNIYSLLEKSVGEVAHKDQPLSNFHPKLWIIKETKREDVNDSQVKVIVLSRNLSFDTSLDVACSMTGKMKTGEVDWSKQEPLVLMLDRLLPYATKERRPKVKTLMEALKKVERFEVDGDYVDYDFFPMMPDGDVLNRAIDLETTLQGEQMIVFSPFIDLATLNWLNKRVKDGKNQVLITRKEWVTKDIFDYYAEHGGEINVMKDSMTDNGVCSIDLHAKMYYVNFPKGMMRYYLFIGSANATRTAMGDEDGSNVGKHLNTEFLLRLEFKRTHYRTESFKTSFINDSKDCKFEQLMVAPSADVSSPKKYTKSERVMKTILAKGRLAAEINEVKPQYYSMIVRRCATNDDGCEVTIAPLPQPKLSMTFKETASFENITADRLSEFYILTVTGDDERTFDCVVKVSTKGMPEDRDNLILKSYINSEDKFLKFVSLMISDSPNETLFDLQQAEDSNSTTTCKSKVSSFEPQFYEQMLKIAATNPERLEEIDDLIKRLNAENVPESFVQMYGKFKSIIHKLKKL